MPQPNKGFALDPVAWMAAGHGEFESPGRYENPLITRQLTMTAELRVDEASCRTRPGLVLIGVSGILWSSLFAIPFLYVSGGWKMVLAAVIFAVVQIAWWSGTAVAGRESMKAITSWCRNARSS